MNLNQIFKSLLLIIVFLSFTQLFAQRKIENQASSNKAPDFTLEDLNGKNVKLSDFKGKVVIINFWATWCPPCKAEIPDFIELYKTYQKKGLVILGIALDNKEKVVKFVKDNGINYPILMGNQEVSNLYGGISGIPTSFVVDRKGIIKNVFVGLRSKEVFEQNIKDNL
ncbi:MAG TPA: TlpA disulfide reductase family protein [Ignavibacteria bacterium]